MCIFLKSNHIQTIYVSTISSKTEHVIFVNFLPRVYGLGKICTKGHFCTETHLHGLKFYYYFFFIDF